MPRIASINISGGGVPKTPVLFADVTPLGLTGDVQRDTRHHGGPERAVCLFSLDLIRALQAEGHPITPGSTGENLTVEGADWPALVPGARLRFAGGVALEITSYTVPCSNIRASFDAGTIHRINQKERPGWSRVYARVLQPGRLTLGEEAALIEPAVSP